MLVHRHVMSLDDSAIISIDASSNGERFAWCSSFGRRVEVREFGSLALIARCRYADVLSVAFGGDDNEVALVGADVAVWNYNEGAIALMMTEASREYGYTNAAFINEGGVLGAIGPSNAVTFWDPSTRREMKRLKCNVPVTSFDVSASGHLVAACCGTEGLVLFDTRSGAIVGRMVQGRWLAGQAGAASSKGATDYAPVPILVRFASGNDAIVVVVDRFREEPRTVLESWKLEATDDGISGQAVGSVDNPLLNPLGHDMSISPDGRFVAVCGLNGRGVIFDITNMDVFATFSHPTIDHSVLTSDHHATYSVEFGEGGKCLATGHSDGSIVIWGVEGK